MTRFDPVALRITFGFFLFSSLWILFSDELLVRLVKDPDLIGVLATLKGLAFVTISALLLYGILNRYFLVLKQENLDRRKIEEQLRTSRTLQHAILDGTPNADYVKDVAGRYLLFNRGAENFVGKMAAEVIGRDDQAIFPPAEAAWVMAGDRAVMEGGVVKIYEEKVTGRTGELLTFLSTKGPVHDEAGRVIGLFGVAHDITQRKRAEEQMRESEQRYRALFEHMHEGFAYCRMVYDGRQQPVDFVYLSVNHSFGRLTGLENVEGRTVTELIPGIREMSPEVFEIYGRVAATGNAETFEFYFKPIKRWLNISAYCPAPGFFAAVFDDITERKLAADELRQSREEFRDLFEHAPVGYHEIDSEGRLVRVNEALLQMLGYTAEELLGQFVWKISAEEEVSRKAALAKLGGEPSPLSFQRWFRRKDGSVFPVLIDDRVVRDSAGRITGLRAIIEDNTERHQAEVALERERTLLRTLIDTIPDPIYVKSSDSRFLLANQALARFMGASGPAELIGRSDVDFFAADLAAGFRADEEQVLAGQAVISQEETIPVNGEGLRQVLTTKVPFRDPQGQIVGLVGIGRDVTGQMQVERALKASEERLQLATLVARIGIFECDHAQDRIHTSELLREIDGLGDSPSIAGRFALLVERSHPADREYVGSRWAELANPAWDGTMVVEFRLQMPDRNYRWLRVRLHTWF